MAERLEQRIADCKRRMAVVRRLIEEQRAAGVRTEEAERVLALEAGFLARLQELVAGGPARDC
jgi:hypothetical protein